MQIYTLIRAENANTNNTNLAELKFFADELNELKNDISLSIGAVAKLMRLASVGNESQIDDVTIHQVGCLLGMLTDISFLCGDFSESLKNETKEHTT